jgi:hypothetical protein
VGHFLADNGGLRVAVVFLVAGKRTHAARFIKKYGRRLRPELYKHFNPMPYDLATVMEVELARQLREQGYGVWQN